MKFFNWYWKKCTLPGRLHTEPKSYLLGFGAGMLTMGLIKYQNKIINSGINNCESLMAKKAKILVDRDFAKRFPKLQEILDRTN